MNHTLLHNPFDCHLQSEGESLEQVRVYTSHPPFEHEGVAATIFRPDSYGSLGQSLLHPLSVQVSNGRQYRQHPPHPGQQDVPFQTGSGFPMSPLTSSCGSSSTSPSSAASSFAFPPHPQFYTNGTNGIGSYSSVSPLYTPALSYPQQAYMQNYPDSRPRITSMSSTSSPGMPPPMRSQGNPNSVSPSLGATVRENYSSTPLLNRHNFHPHANTVHAPSSSHSPMSSSSRGPDPSIKPISTSSGSDYSLQHSTLSMDAPTQFPLSSQSVPPFELTTTHQAMTNSSGVQVHPEICAKIDKGFFKADQDWTCYRRNYFSVACSYSLQPTIDYLNERLYLYRPNSTNRDVIESLSLCITAKVDGEEGKTIDLVQHTPKRDKGPMSAPEPIKLLPHPSGVSGFYQGTSSAQHLPSDYDGIYPRSSPPQQQNQIVANFDRIQFKKATANNGKRRAAQQYFHIVVELFAETSRGKLSEKPPSIKIATRMSAPMVVRGRSPGHYQDERRGSSTSMGPGGGSSGDSGGGSRDPNVTGPSHGGHGSLSRMSFAGSTPMGGGAYQTHHAAFADSSSKSHSSASSSHGSVGSHFFHRPLEPVLTADDASGIEGPGRYQYYPGTLYETATSNNSSRPYLPPVPASVLKLNLLGYADNPPIKQDSRHKSKSFVKQEQHRRPTDEFDGFQLPSFNSHLRTGSLNGFAAAAHMNFGRFQGVETSKGYYPEMPVP